MNLNYFDEVASSTYTSLEKQSLYQLLCATMIIDGNSDSREMAHINKICRILGITSADMEASRRLTEPIMSNCIRNMDMLKKAYVGKFVAQVVLEDGVITAKEEQFFYYMKQKLGLPYVD